jgi:hypothetical protein
MPKIAIMLIKFFVFNRSGRRMAKSAFTAAKRRRV